MHALEKHAGEVPVRNCRFSRRPGVSATRCRPLLVVVQPGRDPSARSGACSITRAPALGRLLAGTSQAICKRVHGRIIGAGVAPEFMPKRNFELIGSHGRRPDDAVPPEIGEWEVHGDARAETRFHFRTGTSSVVAVTDCARNGQPRARLVSAAAASPTHVSSVDWTAPMRILGVEQSQLEGLAPRRAAFGARSSA
jgi:hypothetical protein